MKEIWCVIESSSEGEIFSPDASECFANINDLPEANMKVDFDDDEPLGQVWTDKYSWVWHGFEVTDKLLSIYLMSYMKTKENNNV